MKDIILLFDTACIYEIVILNYFLKFTNSDVVFSSLDGKGIESMEGYHVNVDMSLEQIDRTDIRSFIIPGGNTSVIKTPLVQSMLQELKEKQTVIAAICAGVDVLDELSILEGVESTHSTDMDCVNDNRIITSRANGYVDFAIEVAKELNLFEDEQDLQETIDFWKYHKRMD